MTILIALECSSMRPFEPYSRVTVMAVLVKVKNDREMTRRAEAQRWSAAEALSVRARAPEDRYGFSLPFVLQVATVSPSAHTDLIYHHMFCWPLQVRGEGEGIVNHVREDVRHSVLSHNPIYLQATSMLARASLIEERKTDEAP